MYSLGRKGFVRDIHMTGSTVFLFPVYIMDRVTLFAPDAFSSMYAPAEEGL
jgi:hypothetical protein